jgi:hypothetical protein
MFLSVDDGCSQISSFVISQGPTIDDFNVDGVRSWIYSSGTSQGPHRRRFLALMVDTLGSTYPTPSRGLTINVS